MLVYASGIRAKTEYRGTRYGKLWHASFKGLRVPEDEVVIYHAD